MRVAVVHNLPEGGAARQAQEWISHSAATMIEIRLQGSAVLSPDGLEVQVPQQHRAINTVRYLRPAALALEVATVRTAWTRAARLAHERRVDVVLAHGCKVFHTPPISLEIDIPVMFFAAAGPRRDVFKRPGCPEQVLKRGPWWHKPTLEYVRAIDARAYRRCRAVATNSDFAARWLSASYGYHKPTVIPAGISSAFRAVADDPTRGRELLAVGSVNPHKEFHTVVEVASLVDRPVVIAGPITSHRYAEELLLLAKDRRVNLTLLGKLSDHELRAAYCHAHALVHTSRNEAFGLVLLEAQACGTPVVAARVAGLPETMIDGVTGLLSDPSPASLARTLATLDDQETHRQMSASARSWAQRFTWTESCDILERDLSALANGGVAVRECDVEPLAAQDGGWSS